MTLTTEAALLVVVNIGREKWYTYSAAAQRSTVQRLVVSCPAVRCGAVPCCAMLFRAVLCFLFHTYYIPGIKTSMYVHACGVRVIFLEHGALGICKSPIYHICHLFHSSL